MTRIVFNVLLAAVALGPAAAAQVEIERRRPAPARGEVHLRNDFGAVAVRGWERAEILVRGQLAAGAEGLDLDGDKEGVSVSVSVPDAWFHAAGEDAAFRSTLEITVPVGCRVSVRTVNATVDVEGVRGRLEIETVNGRVRVAGPASEIDVETMTGSVEVQAAGAPVEITSISGAIQVAGALGEAAVETVSGTVDIAGDRIARLQVKSTTGKVTFRGALAPRGEIEIETFSSPVRLTLPRTTRAAFELQSFAGKIASDFCAGTPLTRERFEPYRQLRCSTGPDDFEIRVRTHDSDITVAAEGGEKGEVP
ncbi:MAG TPA: DUF4097 family beta strand repeat-containing protein [Thermoanaerobaculia bacterium]